MAKVFNFNVVPQVIKTPYLDKMYGTKGPQFVPANVSFEMKGVSTNFSNALRRVAIDEVPHFSLDVDEIYTDDGSVFPKQVEIGIHSIGLGQDIDPQVISKAIFSVDVTNNNAHSIWIYSCDLIPNIKMEPIFNKTIPLCELSANCTLRIPKIVIKSGIGIDDARFNASCSGVSKPMDNPPIPDYDGTGSGLSISSMMAMSTHYMIKVTIPATKDPMNDAIDLFVASCKVIQRRLLNIVTAINNENASSISFLQDGNHCTIRIPHETHTIGTIVRESTFLECENSAVNGKSKLESISYKIAGNEDNMMTIEMSVGKKYADEIVDILTRSITEVVLKYSSVSDQIEKLREKKPSKALAAEEPTTLVKKKVGKTSAKSKTKK